MNKLVLRFGIGLFDIVPKEVYLVTTYHPRCWEDMLLRCSLDEDSFGASDWDECCTNQLHHFYYGDIRQYGAPLACGASASRFEPDMSH